MRFLKYCSGALMAVLVASCGGGAGSGTNPAGSSKAYNFVPPKVNSQQIYAETTLDNSNNTINQILRNTVTAVNPDGSHTLVQDDPTNNSIIVNGTTYTTIPESIADNNSDQEVSYTPILANGTGVPCTISPHGAGPSYPLSVAQSWTSNYSITCGTAAPISYTQTGSVVDVESVTVPAGTFSAIKLHITITWTDPHGTTHTESIENWRDTNTAIMVKRVTNFGYSGTNLVNGYPVSRTVVLQSQS